MLIGDFENSVTIRGLSLDAFGDNYPPVKVLLKGHLSATGAVITDSSELPGVALTFTPASALVARYILRSVVEIV